MCARGGSSSDGGSSGNVIFGSADYGQTSIGYCFIVLYRFLVNSDLVKGMGNNSLAYHCDSETFRLGDYSKDYQKA